MKRTKKQNRPAPVKRSQRKQVRSVRQQFHPGRKEQAAEFITALADEPSRDYGTAILEAIWWSRPFPKRPRRVSEARAKEICAGLYAVFSTVR